MPFATTHRTHRAMLPLTACAVLLGALAVAGIWILPHQAVTVTTGGAAMAGFAAIRLASERRVDERVRLTMAEAHEREQDLIRTIDRLIGTQTGPMPVLRGVRDVA